MKLTSIEALVVILVALAVLLGGLLLFGLLWGYGGMMGPWMMAPGRMGGPGLLWLLLFCLPLLLLILILAGAVWLIASRSKSSSARREVSCPRCGRAVQAGWQVCPYCGEPLRRESSQ